MTQIKSVAGKTDISAFVPLSASYHHAYVVCTFKVQTEFH